MKNVLRRYIWDLCFLLVIFLLSSFTFGIMNEYDHIQKIKKQTVSLIDSNSIHLIIQQDGEFDFSFLQSFDNSFALLESASTQFPIFRVIYEKNYFKVEQGRTFQKEDFFNKQGLLLHGVNAEDIIQISPFHIYDTDCQAIGVLSDLYTFESRFAIFFTDGKSDNISLNGGNGHKEFMIIGKNSREIEEVFQKIITYFQDINIEVTKLDKNDVTFQNVYQLEEHVIIVSVLIMLINLGSIWVFVYFWLNQKKIYYQLSYLFGVGRISNCVNIKFFILTTTGLVFSSLLFWRIQITSIFFVMLIYIILLQIIFRITLFNLKRGDWNEKNNGRNYF